jgi:hypothetical protein
MGITRVEEYNSVDMGVLSSDVSELNFGGIIRGKHCAKPSVIKPVLSGTITQLFLFLESNGGYNNAQFGYLASKTAYSDIQAGGAQISNHFVMASDVSDFSTSDRGLELDPIDPEYVWLDAQIGFGATIGLGAVNYRFVFEYS